MATTSPPPELGLRSHDATWNRARWETLPADGNRYEIIDGVLYVSTAPRSFHQWIVQHLFLTLHRQIDETGVGLTFLAPIGVFMPGCDPVQPDITVVRAADRGLFRGGRIEGVPALLIEVLSHSTASVDTVVKRRAYARAGLPEYWIVRPATRDVLVLTRPDEARGDHAEEQLAARDGELRSPTLPVRLRVSELFAGAPDTTL